MLLCLLSCSSNQEVPVFDSNQAFDHLVKQVEFGPRVPGSAASLECRKYFVQHLRASGLKVDSQVFIYDDPYSDQQIRMVNLIASTMNSAKTEPGLIICAHYDSRPRTDFHSDQSLKDKPIDGANDGASGAAVLLELASIFKTALPGDNIDLVFFDGEDWGEAGDLDHYLLGSRHFVRTGVRGKYRYGILIDLIGDKDQQIYKEGYSQQFAPELNDYVFKTAKKLGLTTFVDSVKYTVTDDHLMLNTVGIPTVNLIDFDYPFWHTENDSPDKCSPESLGNVGQLLLEIIYNGSL